MSLSCLDSQHPRNLGHGRKRTSRNAATANTFAVSAYRSMALTAFLEETSVFMCRGAVCIAKARRHVLPLRQKNRARFRFPKWCRASFSSQTTSSSSVSSCSFFLRPSLATCLTAVSSRRSLFTHFPSLRFRLCSVLVTLALLSRFPSDRVHPFHPRTTNHDFPFPPTPRCPRILQCRLDSFDPLFDDLAALPIRCMSL